MPGLSTQAGPAPSSGQSQGLSITSTAAAPEPGGDSTGLSMTSTSGVSSGQGGRGPARGLSESGAGRSKPSGSKGR